MVVEGGSEMGELLEGQGSSSVEGQHLRKEVTGRERKLKLPEKGVSWWYQGSAGVCVCGVWECAGGRVSMSVWHQVGWDDDRQVVDMFGSHEEGMGALLTFVTAVK